MSKSKWIAIGVVVPTAMLLGLSIVRHLDGIDSPWKSWQAAYLASAVGVSAGCFWMGDRVGDDAKTAGS